MLNAYFVTHIHLQLNIWFLCLGSSSELIAIVLNYLARRLETWMPSWVLLLHFLYTNKSKPFRTREKQLNAHKKYIIKIKSYRTRIFRVRSVHPQKRANMKWLESEVGETLESVESSKKNHNQKIFNSPNGFCLVVTFKFPFVFFKNFTDTFFSFRNMFHYLWS